MNGIKLVYTQKFTVIGTEKEKDDRVASSLSQKMGIFLDINEPYTRQTIQKALKSRNFDVTLGPGDSDLMDPVPLPAHCHFQWAEYERIDWSAVLAGQHGAASYCIRKGLSRKAQLAYYTHRHVCKNPDSILAHALPQTVILDTWPVWEDGGDGPRAGLADVVVSIGSSSAGGSAVNRKEKLDQCLAEAKEVMHAAERYFDQDPAARQAPVWILKGSTANKGVGIHILHLYEQLVDLCWSEQDIREWYVVKVSCKDRETS
jgi:hypothetical protein